MNYFSKIEAYFAGDMTSVEQTVFEQELEENSALQKEVEAFQTAQQLFGWVAEQLPVAAIADDNAIDTAEQLIAFTAHNLSESEILEKETAPSLSPTIRTLIPRKNRNYWFAAASVLLIISVLGIRFQQNQASWETLGPQEGIVTLPIEKPLNIPIKSKPLDILRETPMVENEVENVLHEHKKGQHKSPKRIYEPAKIVTKIEKSPNQHLAATASKNNKIDDRHLVIAQPIAMNTSAQKITTKIIVPSGQSVTYKAKEVITLKTGFHAKAGANFVASTNESRTVNLTLDKTIIDNKMVVEAANTISLKPGFHAKSGSTFLAKTNPKSIPADLITNAVVSDKETIIYKAKNSISLKEGTHIKPGAEVLVSIANK